MEHTADYHRECRKLDKQYFISSLKYEPDRKCIACGNNTVNHYGFIIFFYEPILYRTGWSKVPLPSHKEHNK